MNRKQFLFKAFQTALGAGVAVAAGCASKVVPPNKIPLQSPIERLGASDEEQMIPVSREDYYKMVRGYWPADEEAGIPPFEDKFKLLVKDQLDPKKNGVYEFKGGIDHKFNPSYYHDGTGNIVYHLDGSDLSNITVGPDGRVSKWGDLVQPVASQQPTLHKTEGGVHEIHMQQGETMYFREKLSDSDRKKIMEHLRPMSYGSQDTPKDQRNPDLWYWDDEQNGFIKGSGGVTWGPDKFPIRYDYPETPQIEKKLQTVQGHSHELSVSDMPCHSHRDHMHIHTSGGAGESSCMGTYAAEEAAPTVDDINECMRKQAEFTTKALAALREEIIADIAANSPFVALNQNRLWVGKGNKVQMSSMLGDFKHMKPSYKGLGKHV